MEKGPRPDGLTNRQRAKREAETQKNKVAKLKKRIGMAAGTAVASLTLIGGAYISQRGGDSGSMPIPSGPEEDYGSRFPMRDLEPEYVDNIAVQVSEDFATYLGIDLSSQNLLEDMKFAPNYSKMTPAEKTEFCGDEIKPLPCMEAAGYLTSKDEIIIYKDQFDYLFQNRTDSQDDRKLRDEALYNVVAHEASHWHARAFQASDELYALMVKHYGDEQPLLKDISQFKNGGVDGAFMRATGVNDGRRIEIFRGIEEAEAELTSRFLLIQGKRGDGKFLAALDPTDTYFVEERRLMEDMLRKLGADYSETMKMLTHLRTVENGRENLMIIVGKRFGASEADALEHGFKIYKAIDYGDVQAYRALTNQ